VISSLSLTHLLQGLAGIALVAGIGVLMSAQALKRRLRTG
jgi:hypothetical protein